MTFPLGEIYIIQSLNLSASPFSLRNFIKDEILMEPKLTLLIIENNPVISARLTDLLNEYEEVNKVLNAVDFNSAYTVLKNRKVNIILLCIHISDADILELVSICTYESPCSLIILSDHPQNFYKERYKHLGLNYWLDKAHDFDLIPQLIDRISKDTA